MSQQFTKKQLREIEYHRDFAERHKHILAEPFSYDAVYSAKRRWWNAYWEMYRFLRSQNLKGKRVLVIGCGFGRDAIRLAKVGAQVEAFDLSPDSLAIAETLASRENVAITFRRMQAEELEYGTDSFDCVVACDILHHVEIPKTMKEIVRTSKNGAVFVANEVYSHSFTNIIRHSTIVDKVLYPRMVRFVYKGRQPYITCDERKLTEKDIVEIMRPLGRTILHKYYGLFVGRVVPNNIDVVSKIDRGMLAVLGPVAPLLGGRVLFAATVGKRRS